MSKSRIYDAHNGDYGRVWLDGKEMEDVTSCCPDEGWLVRLARDENGDAIIDPGPELRREILEGKVEFQPEERPPDLSRATGLPLNGQQEATP